MKQTALRPTFANFNVVDEEPKVKGVLTEEEISLQSLSEHSGWKILTQYIDELKEGIDLIVSNSISSGATREEVGENAIVANLAKGVISRIQGRVQDACDAVRKSNGQ